MHTEITKNLKGILYVALGATSYGVLATFMKMANNEGLSTGILTISQYVLGLLFVYLSALFYGKKKETSDDKTKRADTDSVLKIMAFGTSLGLTSSFYYLSIQFVPVSVAIVLLMQAIWMGLVFEFFIDRKLLSKVKIAGAAAAIAGTLLAVNIFDISAEVQWQGIVLGLAAAASFATTMLATNRVGIHLPDIQRTKYFVAGGLVVVLIFWNLPGIKDFQFSQLDYAVILSRGAFFALFGTALPPLLFSKGFPLTGVGLGSIVSSLELPVSVFSAFILLHEEVLLIQWAGVAVILISVALVNKGRSPAVR